MTEEALWELAAKGEKKGRLFGFGNKLRMSKANRELDAIEASVSNPTKSTATSAEDCQRKFTQSEVANLVAKELAAAQEKFAKDMEAQEKFYKDELDKVVGDTSYNKRCFDALFRHNGIPMPSPGETTNPGVSFTTYQ